MINHLVIAGGGTAGWMTAAMFCNFFKESELKITLVESDEIGTVGVGEATIPHLRYFNEKLGINEHEFMRKTNATFKLGIEFANWKKEGHSYIHPFSSMGFDIKGSPFYHYWARAYNLGLEIEADDFSIATRMAKLGRFRYPDKSGHYLDGSFSYAFHIDSSRYAHMLREYCEKGFPNFSRVEGKIEQVARHSNKSGIKSLLLKNGDTIEGDFYIDCSGFRSLLLSQELGAKAIDLSEHLPCNSAIAAPTDDKYPDMPFSRATAHKAGWQWKIPLKHRTGNGCVYSSHYMNDDEALEHFKKNITGELLADPKLIRFQARRMDQSWIDNCVAVGLSSGFLEPLESTGIHLIQMAIMKLVELLPAHKEYSAERDEFNRQMRDEYEKIRDFLVLHYYITERKDSAFWQYIREMELPETLQQRIGLIKEYGQVDQYQHGLFLQSSWAYVYFCQGGKTFATFNKTDHLNNSDLISNMRSFNKEIDQFARKKPTQSTILDKIYDGTTEETWPNASMSLYEVFS